MTLTELREKVRTWDNHTGDPFDPLATSKYGTILNQIDYHAAREWRTHLPSEHPNFNSNYMERLAAWIGNVPLDHDQKLLLEYALYISFFSHDDFVALYRTAMSREISRWVAQQVSARLDSGGGQAFHNLVDQALHTTTWFCPITDSMDINEFYKVNHIKGVAHRPGFATLEMLAAHAGDGPIAQAVGEYMAKPNLRNKWLSLERIVLLEDVVGSGTQCLGAIRWAVNNLSKPILFVPLILCPNGVEALQTEERNSRGLLTVRPVIELRRADLLGPERQCEDGWPITDKVENFVDRSCGAWPQHDPFGYKQTGCSLATFSNTPDNSLPLIHCKTLGWEPLFPRVFRD